MLGLVLSSGAARGSAHVGVLLALEELGIVPDLAVGTSSGALVAGAWAAGVATAEVAERTRRASLSDFGHPRSGLGPSVLETESFVTHLDEVFHGSNIEDLPRRFGAVATDLNARSAALLDSGPVADAILASTAVPGIFPPVVTQGHTFIDGVLTSALPVWAAESLGATTTIGVRLRAQNPANLRSILRGRVFTQAPDIAPSIEIFIDTTPYASWSARDANMLIDLGYKTAMQVLTSEPASAALRTHKPNRGS